VHLMYFEQEFITICVLKILFMLKNVYRFLTKCIANIHEF